MQGIFTPVASVDDGDVLQELQWDGREGFMLRGTVKVMGMASEEEVEPSNARDMLKDWAFMVGLRRMRCLEADAEALAAIMEGREWHGLQKSTR